MWKIPTVAIENEKLKEELKYADVKSLKERHSKLVIYVDFPTFVYCIYDKSASV